MDLVSSKKHCPYNLKMSIEKWGTVLEIVKYLYETCHADVETKNNYGSTPISIASLNDQLEIVKYLYETCHANVTNDVIKRSPTKRIKEYLRSLLWNRKINIKVI